MAVELSRVDRFIYERLRDWPELEPLVGDRIYADLAPEGAAYPFVVFQMQSEGTDSRDVGGNRVLANPLYLVRVYAESSSWQGAVSQAADEVDRALARVSNVEVADARVIACIRESAWRLIEDEYRSVGGLYRIWIRAED